MLAIASKLPSHRSGTGREGLRKGEVRRKGSGLLLSVLHLEDSPMGQGLLSSPLTKEDSTGRKLPQDGKAGGGLTCLGAGQGAGEEEPGVSLWAHHMGFWVLSL